MKILLCIENKIEWLILLELSVFPPLEKKSYLKLNLDLYISVIHKSLSVYANVHKIREPDSRSTFIRVLETTL